MAAVPKNILLACFFVTVTLVHAQPTTKQAKIDRILELSNLGSTSTQVNEQVRAMMSSQIKSQMPNATPEQLAISQRFQDKLMDLVAARVSPEKLKPAMAKAYDELYTEDEINGMLAFFESPVGRSYLGKTGQLVQKTMAVTQELMRDMVPEMQRITMEMAAEIQAAKQKQKQ
jgi:hypothetical protein